MLKPWRELENEPEADPAIPEPEGGGEGAETGFLSARAAALDPAPIWRRIESYTRVRYTPRKVTWHVDGPGQFEPPLEPVVDIAFEVFTDGSGWAAIEPAEAPAGFELEHSATYRAVAQIGVGTPPPSIFEAFRRLVEYNADSGGARAGPSGAARAETDLDGKLHVEVERDPRWLARAMIQSGAADLLRPYRRRAS